MSSAANMGGSLLAAGKKHQSLLLGISLVATGFLVIAANAVWNQNGAHPAMLLSPAEGTGKNAITLSRDTIPVRKVATRPIGTQHLTPVPSRRPSEIAGQSVEQNKVFKLQKLLFAQGYIIEKPDGIWGPVTAKATTEFLKDKGMPLALEEIRNAPEMALAKLETSQSKTGSTTADGIGELLKKDTLSPTLIAKVQVGLINYGHRDIAIDGIVGSQTKAAISAFEERFDMPVTGKPSRKLIEKLYSVGALTK